MARTTLTLDDDVEAKLKAEARRTRQSFRDVVNEVLRRGLSSRVPPKPVAPFRVETRDTGRVAPGLSLDSVADLIERVEGPLHG